MVPSLPPTNVKVLSAEHNLSAVMRKLISKHPVKLRTQVRFFMKEVNKAIGRI